jgi:hypothetical protein
MKKQQGMTIIGMLFTVVIVIMATVIVLRSVPVYLQHYEIVQSIKSLSSISASSLSGDPMADIETLKNDLNKRLDVNGIEDLGDKQVLITPDGDHQFKVRLKYEVVKPLAYNVSLLFHFDETYKVVIIGAQ